MQAIMRARMERRSGKRVVQDPVCVLCGSAIEAPHPDYGMAVDSVTAIALDGLKSSIHSELERHKQASAMRGKPA